MWPLKWLSVVNSRYGVHNLLVVSAVVSAKLHYTDTGYKHVVHHHQRTSSQQFYNLLYNKFATSQCQSPTSRHVKMLGCGKFLSVGERFVVQQVVEYCCELVRWWCCTTRS